ncbi:MAG: transglycosylase domain-containing protein [Lachnospiraceae bacterium]|nr:transglycosylase domain-containing protein [Lachnospiraceae bacterium]
MNSHGENIGRGIIRGIGHGVKRIIQLLFLLLLLAIVSLAIWFYVKYGKQLFAYQSRANALVEASTEETFRASQTSLVYAADGQLISALKGEKDVYYLSYDSIPEYVIDAVLSVEDRKFFEHDGIDLFANIRAAIALIENEGEIHQGGSTITQQLARNVFLTNEVTWERKITEIFAAMALERKYNKKQILEFYLNNIYFANGYYGIQAASKGYFGVSVKELSLSQVAFLCAIPNDPTDYNPLTRFESALSRRDKVLLQMWEQEKITDAEYQAALKEKIVLQTSETTVQNFAESYTYFCAIRALMEQQGFVLRNEFTDEADKANYEKQYYEAYYLIQKRLYTEGYRIYTSIDLKKQAQLQAALDAELAVNQETDEGGTYLLQGSAVCIDNDTGRVVAVIGGREQEIEGYTLNRAYQSFRQPGSSIKPLIVYTPMFERGMYPDDIVVDERFEGGPRNSGNVYSGEIPVSRAIAVSKNTVAWKLFDQLTPTVGLSYLLHMNFRKIVPTDYVPAAALGGFTYGTNTVEMASAYATLENDGVFYNPTCIVKIMDAEGNEIIGDRMESKRVYSVNAARIMTSCLQGVMETGTGRKLTVKGQNTAGKTGTTNDQKDGWFVGYTKYYTTAVWVGFDMPREMEDLMGNTYPGRIWQSFMTTIHEGLEAKEFEMYEDLRPKEDPGVLEEEDAEAEDSTANAENAENSEEDTEE